MRLLTILPHQTERVNLMIDSVAAQASIVAPEHVKPFRFYARQLARKVATESLDWLEESAWHVMTNIQQGAGNRDKRLTVFGGLIEFCYLCGWSEAEAVFSHAQNEQVERTA